MCMRIPTSSVYSPSIRMEFYHRQPRITSHSSADGYRVYCGLGEGGGQSRLIGGGEPTRFTVALSLRYTSPAGEGKGHENRD